MKKTILIIAILSCSIWGITAKNSAQPVRSVNRTASRPPSMIIGASPICTLEESEYTYTLDSLTADSASTVWSTAGRIRIVGSNIGSSVVVEYDPTVSTGPMRGTLYAAISGGSIISKVIFLKTDCL